MYNLSGYSENDLKGLLFVMSFWHQLLTWMDTSMEVPQSFGTFHLIWLALSFLAVIPLLCFPKKQSPDHVRRVVLVTAIIVVLFEIYKQINFSSQPENGFEFNYAWYAFPFQFCSTPMYIGLLAGLTKPGKLHDSFCAYLATFAVFAGTAVMLYPGNVFIETAGINVQTMVCHGSMITMGIYLYATGHVKLSHKTILKALPVFATTLGLALIMNEVAYHNLPEGTEFNMFYISPYFENYLPIYSDVHRTVPAPWNILIYIAGFTAAAYVILLLAMAIGKLVGKVRRPAVV